MVFAHGTLLYILLPSFDPIVHYDQSVPQYKYCRMWTANIISFSHSRLPNQIVGRQGVPQHWSHLVAILHEHSSSVNVLSFSPDGSRLASGSYDHTVRLWDGSTGVPITTLEGHSESVTSLSFSPDGSRLALGLYDHTVRLWDCASGVPIATLEGHSDFVTSLSFLSDGSQLASGSDDSTVRLWDGALGVPIATLKGHSRPVTSLSFLPYRS